MSQYIKVFNTRSEYEEWLSGYTEGYAVSAYIISENATVGKEYAPFLTASADTTSFAYPATSTTLHIKSNLNWTLTKPSWVTMETSGSCAADLTMAIAANDESKNSRSGNVVISYNQTSSQTISLTQAGNPEYEPVVPYNEIWYTTTDGNPITGESGGFTFTDKTLVSNTYSGGKGILSFNGEISGLYRCSSKTNLQTIILPNSVTRIGLGGYTFVGCSSLETVYLGNNINYIDGEFTFKGCTSLTSLTINTVTVPTLAEGGLLFYQGNDPTIYVPSASVNAYKSTGNWNLYYSTLIQAIPE